LKKKATKVAIPESTKSACEIVARDVPEFGNDTSFENNDLEDDLVAKQNGEQSLEEYKDAQ